MNRHRSLAGPSASHGVPLVCGTWIMLFERGFHGYTLGCASLCVLSLYNRHILSAIRSQLIESTRQPQTIHMRVPTPSTCRVSIWVTLRLVLLQIINAQSILPLLSTTVMRLDGWAEVRTLLSDGGSQPWIDSPGPCLFMSPSVTIAGQSCFHNCAWPCHISTVRGSTDCRICHVRSFPASRTLRFLKDVCVNRCLTPLTNR